MLSASELLLKVCALIVGHHIRARLIDRVPGVSCMVELCFLQPGERAGKDRSKFLQFSYSHDEPHLASAVFLT